MTAKAPLLLVSVRNANEAREAVSGGADIIDVKEPDRGPLGAADPNTLQEIAREVGIQKPLSAAMGELTNAHQNMSLSSLTGYRWLKFGMSLCDNSVVWRVNWTRLENHFNGLAQLVAASYADFGAASCQPPLEIAKSLHLCDSIFLLDTFVKDGRSVFDAITLGELTRLRFTLHSFGARLALAGSLSAKDVDKIVACRPDIVGIRGAACVDGRASPVCSQKVRAFRDAIEKAFSANPRELQVTRSADLSSVNFA